MKDIWKDHKFIISVIIGIMGFIGLDNSLKFFNITICLIPRINLFISKYFGMLLVAIMVIMFNVERKQSLILKKLGMLTPDTMIIISDSKTKFTGSNAYKHLLTNTNAVPVTNINRLWREADRSFPELMDAMWIADRKEITEDEAIKGGDYAFQREFEINFELSRLRSAELYLLVDDICELVVNGYRFEKVRGFLEHHSHKFDLTKHVIKGNNRLQFVIENIQLHEMHQHSDNKIWLNPYGFKYLLSIKYFK